MDEAAEQLAIQRAHEARHGQVGIGQGDVFERLRLALQDVIALGGLAELEHGAAAVGARSMRKFWSRSPSSLRPCAAEAIGLRREGVQRVERKVGRAQRLEHGRTFHCATRKGGALRRRPVRVIRSGRLDAGPDLVAHLGRLLAEVERPARTWRERRPAGRSPGCSCSPSGISSLRRLVGGGVLDRLGDVLADLPASSTKLMKAWAFSGCGAPFGIASVSCQTSEPSFGTT